MDKQLVTLLWWPHSGGRWLSRSILNNHSKIFQTTFVHPWIFNSTDDMFKLDITSQIHKARSLEELRKNMEILKVSTDEGRKKGLEMYFRLNKENLCKDEKVEVVLGESCLGSPEPKSVDLDSIYSVVPTMKTIHLVRNPVYSLHSFMNRFEMDSNPVRIAGSWLTHNANIRTFFKDRPESYLCVRYEDLVDNPEHELIKICNFLNVEFERNMLSKLEQRWGKGTKDEVQPTHREIVENIAQTEMKNYNYL